MSTKICVGQRMGLMRSNMNRQPILFDQEEGGQTFDQQIEFMNLLLLKVVSEIWLVCQVL